MSNPPLSRYINPATQFFLRSITNQRTRTLEIGCGPGQYRLAVHGKYIGVDITSDNYYPDVPRTPDVVADAARLPFKDAVFDVAFFSNTFHFLPDPDSIVQETIRVLRPGGQLVLFDYSRRTVERLRAAYASDGQNVTTTVRTCRQWIDLLHQSGLTHVQLEANSLAKTDRLLRVMNIPIMRSAYFKSIDMREHAIVVAGHKPRCEPSNPNQPFFQ
jgi:ubiquinone/menaquinone biosynthesis C-methylase UbiE